MMLFAMQRMTQAAKRCESNGEVVHIRRRGHRGLLALAALVVGAISIVLPGCNELAGIDAPADWVELDASPAGASDPGDGGDASAMLDRGDESAALDRGDESAVLDRGDESAVLARDSELGAADSSIDARASDRVRDGSDDTVGDVGRGRDASDASSGSCAADPNKACSPGDTKAESGACGPCGKGTRARTNTCSAACKWVTGSWSTCHDTGAAPNHCSRVEFCDRKLAIPDSVIGTECTQFACTREEALAECMAEMKEACLFDQPKAQFQMHYCDE